MIPGMNPKQMKQMMKKLGMSMDQLDDVERVVIYTKQGNYIFENAEVVSTTMQGVTTYQVSGESNFEPAEIEIPAEDVTLVAGQTGVTEEEALAALRAAKGDIAEAILNLTGA